MGDVMVGLHLLVLCDIIIGKFVREFSPRKHQANVANALSALFVALLCGSVKYIVFLC